ncbi:hypothetical protein HWQ46_03155 [Shewanella sp. D64]|uniref:hypothetical protein n=1 Tax=unclassified Shewanella TaxID=196818 RepID=UPI0022BA2320|nr:MULTISPECIES: hypothetical protein [unclassified Shewanella]MEC4724545.1 hypothetical protein [Shewanella sp. D64]MEC4736678.1 hypothetical protein [Shewanella sp. E94]WBJ94652.1 hypothetical protein HWQ47_22795 [Shewanella sp. MTB7]
MKKTDTKVRDLSPEQEKAVVDAKEVLASKQDTLLQLGQVQAFNFISKLVTVTELKVLQNIKESKSYKGLTYKNENGELVTVTSWDECCQYILLTDRRNVDNRLITLEQFGEEFFEASKSMGLGYRDLRKLRQLPESDQNLVIDSEAIDMGDKEAVKELIEDLTDKHATEKVHLKEQLGESQKLAMVRNNLLQDANNRLNITTEELEQFKVQKNNAPEPNQWAKQVHEINQLSTRLAAKAIELAEQLDDVSETIMATEVNEQHSERAMEHMAAVQVHCVDQLFLAVNALSIETRQRFDFYVNQGRPMYSEAEILALETEIDARG